MKDILTEDLLNSLRLMKYDRSRTLMENNLLIEQGVWDSKSGDNRYWVELYNRLKSFGINVKYGTSDGKQTNDPNKSTFLYWGQWIIWKDLNKNGGYPIQIYSSAGSALFKWSAGKYKGEELSKSLVNSKISKNATFLLSDFLPLNDAKKADKLIRYGGCESSLVGGIDVYKEAQKLEEFPHCKKNLTKTVSKNDPLYDVKTNTKMSDFKPTDKYGGSVEYFVGNKKNDISTEAIKSRYESGMVKDLYDLVILPEYDNKDKDIEDLKYSKETVKMGNYNTVLSEKDNKVKYGLDVYKKALGVRRTLAKVAGWVGAETIDVPWYSPLSSTGNPNYFYEFLQTPSSVALNPMDLEVRWVELKIQYLNQKIKEKNGNKFSIGTFENLERLRAAKGGVLSHVGGTSTFRIPDNVSPLDYYKQQKKNTDKGSGLTISSPESSKENPWNYVITDYEKRLEDFLKNANKNSEITKNISVLKKDLDELKSAIDDVYERNLNLSKQSSNFINLACTDKIKYSLGHISNYPKYMSLFRENIPRDNDQFEYKMETGYLDLTFSLKKLCTSEKLGGVFTMTSEEKERSYLKGFNWSKLKFEWASEKRSDQVTCFCSHMKVLEYENIEIAGNVEINYSKCPKGPTKGGCIKQGPLILASEQRFTIKPYQYLFSQADNRRFTQKVFDWTKKCFTASNDEGEMGKDFHCLLDVASIAVTFIPVWGPLISMIIDTLNAAYFVADAMNADNNLDKNSAYFSAALTFIGGLATGFGDARALIKKGPSGLKILGYAENYMVKSAKIQQKGLSKEMMELELKKLMIEMNNIYRLTTKEIQIAQKYINSIELLGKDQAVKLLSNYKKSLDNLQAKIGFRRWEQLMVDEKFVEFMKKANGNVFEALKLMNKKVIKKEFWQQFGFFAGGESILPGLISPLIMEKIRKGEWGTFEQNLSANRYELASVAQEFMIDDEFDINEKLIPAWNETCTKKPQINYCVKDGSKFKAWRPGYKVPLAYRTNNYKKYIEEVEKMEKVNLEREEIFLEIQSKLEELYDVKIKQNGELKSLYPEQLVKYSVIVPEIKNNISKLSLMCDNTDYESYPKLKKLNTVFQELEMCKKETKKENTNKDDNDYDPSEIEANKSFEDYKKIKW